MTFVLHMLETGKMGSTYHKLDPRAKFLWWVCMIVVPILVTNPLVLLVFVIWFWIMSIGAGIAKPMYKFLIVTYPIMVGFIIITWPFFYAATPDQHFLFNWSIFHYSLEGLFYALAMGLRIVTALTACTFFVMVTDLMDLASAIGEFMQNKLHISYMYPLMVISSFKFLPELSGDYVTITESFRSRALDMETGSFFERLRKVVPVAIPLIDSMLRRAQRIAIALELKAFDASSRSRTFYKEHHMGGWDYAFILSGVASIIVCVLLMVLGWARVEVFL